MSEGGALRLAAVCARARAAGLAPGQMLADARALLPALQVHPAEPAADAKLLDDLLTWCERYTPLVAVDRSAPHEAGGALWLDLTGCAHLFGGEAALCADLLARLARQGLAAAAGIADAPGAAWAAARFAAPGSEIVPPGGAAPALSPLPVAALRLPPELTAMLERLGLARIGDLAPLPRAALTARFGTELVSRLDQAHGRLAEPISPRTPLPAHRAELVLAEPVAHAEGLAALSLRLLAELCAGLEACGLGARRLTLAFYRVDNTSVCARIGTSRPCRARRELQRLLAEKLEEIDPGFGIERAILRADVVEPLAARAARLARHGRAAISTRRAISRPLVDRLSNRLGADAVGQLAPQASHWPERAQRRVPALSEEKRVPFPDRRLHGPAPARPLRLLARPEPIETLAPVPDEPPVLFRWRQALHKVAKVRGPERLAPEWWREPDGDPNALTRDYFAVEDQDGGRFWLYREGLYLAGAMTLPRWYLHGLFA